MNQNHSEHFHHNHGDDTSQHMHSHGDHGSAVAALAGKYTCPMHPEIEQDHPGDCPICGMRLEPKTVSAEDSAEHAEITSVSRKFWIGLVFTVPVLFLAMGHLIPGLHIEKWMPRSASKWVEFVLATPVVLWAGGMFFSKAWRSLVNRSLNMFTLIATGVGAAYFYSAVAVLAPGVFPESFREKAARWGFTSRRRP